MTQDALLIPLLLVLLGAIPLFAFGYAIGIKKKYHLIAGWKESGMKENPELASGIGNPLFLAGAIVVVAAASSYIGFVSDGWTVAICVFAALYAVIRSIYISVKITSNNA